MYILFCYRGVIGFKGVCVFGFYVDTTKERDFECDNAEASLILRV